VSDDAPGVASRPVACSIAGSDAGGGAGIQADLRVFSRVGVFGTTVITAVTAQNLTAVTHVEPLSLESIGRQLEAVATGFRVDAMKTGMLWSPAITSLVARFVGSHGVPCVVDPVMAATSGGRLLDVEARAVLVDELAPVSALVTPNLDEAVLLLGRAQRIERAEIDAVALALVERLRAPVLLKGGHLEGDPVDVLAMRDGSTRVFAWPRVRSVNTHGSGCMLSAACAARLALGDPLAVACERALAFVHEALARPIDVSGALLAGIERVSLR
jgi:hydroxymethylpyrimidine/phosphomethylpyrimidine kinase